MSSGSEVRQKTVQANGLEFAYLEMGDGPPVLLLHGFPDDAWTWSNQLGALAEAGYRAVAPFMRGYAPTEIPDDGRYDAEALAGDVAGLVRALGEESAHVVGNDWGGVTTYAAMALHPELVWRAVVINIGHPATFTETLLHPRQIQHIFHFWLFQTPELALTAAQANDLALLDHLWDYWSEPGHDFGEHLERVKRETLSGEGRLEAALGYYRALVELPATRPEIAQRILGPIDVPTLSVFGAQDPPRELSENEHVHFTGEYRLEIVDGARHFVHREQPEQTNRLILDWLGADRRTTPDEAEPVAAGTDGE
jgi:pimeloyl-ACP methyl ester carboxylesterase